MDSASHLRTRPTILLVDDEPMILDAMTRALRREPYVVLRASCGSEALEIVNRMHVDVVLTDERMPEMCGSELLSRIRESHPDVVRILMSGAASLAEAAQAIGRGGIYRFLNKPVGPDVVVKTIDNALAMRELLLASSRLRSSFARSSPPPRLPGEVAAPRG